MDARIVDAVRAFVNAPSSQAAAAVFEREREWLSLPEVLGILGATIEGHRAQPGYARDLAIVQARWDLLDRLLEVGPEAALAAFDAAIETVLELVNAPVERGVVLDIDPARLASREAQWVFADLLMQASDDATDALILRRWQGAREAARAGQLRQSPLARGAATGPPAGAASVVPDQPDAAAATIAGLEAELAAPGGDADAARRRDLRLALSAAHLECRSGDRAAHLRAALAQLDRLQQELLADRLYAVDGVAREQLLRTYVNLGAAYRASADFAVQERGDGASAVSLVDTAFESYRAAESLAGSEPVTALVAIALHSGLGALLSWRGERRQAVEHYALALQTAREAGDRERAALVDHDLGDELAKMEDELPGARLLAIDHLRAALAFYSSDGWRSHRQQTLRALGRLLFDMRDWAGAEAVLSEAVALGQGILRGAADAGAIRRQVQADAEIFAASAFCLLRLGRVDDAVRRIEQGKARVTALRDGAIPGAGERGRGADRVDAEVEWGGRDDALFAGMPPGGAVVLSLVTRAGAAAIVVPDGAQHAAQDGASSLSATHVAWLDHDSEATLLDLAFGPQGWLDSYFRHAPEGDQRWDDAIDRLAGASWRHYAGPIVERLQAIGVPSGAEIAVVPWGRLAMLPLACAWRIVDGGRRYAIEDFAFCQSPSLQLLARARRLACEPERQEPRLLAVADPGGDLPGAIAESERVGRLFVAHGAPEPVLLRGAQATLAAVRDALPQAGCWLFSCHGRFHWGSPAMSELELAGGDSLALNALPGIGGGLPRVRLAVLTACESGLSDVLRAPDEFDGFPAALLALGVPAVLGTSWPVDDAASAVLVGRFFERWLSGRPHVSPAQALRLAQLDLMAMPADRYDAGAPAGAAMRDRLFYWGGFALTGA